jgi:hypothetical protein
MEIDKWKQHNKHKNKRTEQLHIRSSVPSTVYEYIYRSAKRCSVRFLYSIPHQVTYSSLPLMPQRNTEPKLEADDQENHEEKAGLTMVYRHWRV